jgi:ribosomal protein L7/L12
VHNNAFIRDRKIESIKAVRSASGMGLKEAKDFVEAVAYIGQPKHIDVDPAHFLRIITELRVAGLKVD